MKNRPYTNFLKLIFEKTPCRQKDNKIELFLQILVLADMTTTKRSLFQEKNAKFKPFVVKSLLEPTCKRFSKSAIRKNVSLKLNPQSKKS